MANVGPFIHAWVLPSEIEAAVWNALHQEVVAVLRVASAELEQHRRGEELALLRGPNGFGPLVIQPQVIAFNGNAFLGQAGGAFVLEQKAQSGIISRRDTGDSRRAVRRCETEGLPYDLAVCAALLSLVRHLGDEARVGTTGSLRSGWGHAAEVVRAATGEAGQLVQQENGVIRWITTMSRSNRRSRSSA